MKFLIVFFMLFAADAVAQHPGCCSASQPPQFSGRLMVSHKAGDAVNLRERRQSRRVTYSPHVRYEAHVTYSPHVPYRAGDPVFVARRRAYAPLIFRPQAYYYSNILNYQGNFSY